MQNMLAKWATSYSYQLLRGWWLEAPDRGGGDVGPFSIWTTDFQSGKIENTEPRKKATKKDWADHRPT